MCLYRLTHEQETPTEGYKILLETDNGLTSPLLGELFYTIGKPYVDTNDFLIECGASIENYQTGFHIFKTFEAAKHRLREYRFFSNDVYIIAKVSAKDVVATGYESVSTGVLQPIKQVDVFVAKEMILEKIVYTTYNQVWRRFKEWLHSKFSSRG